MCPRNMKTRLNYLLSPFRGFWEINWDSAADTSCPPLQINLGRVEYIRASTLKEERESELWKVILDKKLQVHCSIISLAQSGINLPSNPVSFKKRHNLTYHAVIATLPKALTSTPLSECAVQSVNLILSNRHSTMHPHAKTLFSLLSLFMYSHLLLLVLYLKIASCHIIIIIIVWCRKQLASFIK